MRRLAGSDGRAAPVRSIAVERNSRVSRSLFAERIPHLQKIYGSENRRRDWRREDSGDRAK
jgi:hypothetical protein